MKKMSKKEMTQIKGGKGRSNAKNEFPTLPAEGQDGLVNAPELPAAQNGKGKRPF